MRSAAFPVIFAVLLFLPAGRLDWLAGWLYLAVLMISLTLNYIYLRRVNPDIIEHRSRMGKGTKGWDKIWLGVFAVVIIAMYITAALDAGRYGWSTMPLLLWPVGLAVFVPGTILLTWSMGVNPFFEKTVRIQAERGHEVIDTGPYAIVRHPGYVGLFGWLLSAPMMLGSWWALGPAVLCIIALIVRTALEDRTLREELPHYIDYAGRVRYRLIPWIW